MDEGNAKLNQMPSSQSFVVDSSIQVKRRGGWAAAANGPFSNRWEVVNKMLGDGVAVRYCQFRCLCWFNQLTGLLWHNRHFPVWHFGPHVMAEVRTKDSEGMANIFNTHVDHNRISSAYWTESAIGTQQRPRGLFEESVRFFRRVRLLVGRTPLKGCYGRIKDQEHQPEKLNHGFVLPQPLIGLLLASVGMITMGIGWFIFRGYLFAQQCSFGFIATLMGALLLFAGLFIAGASLGSHPFYDSGDSLDLGKKFLSI
jgi:hypothetical protein